MPKDQFKTGDILHLDDNNNLIVSFPKKEQFCISSSCFSEVDLQNIRDEKYCGGCTSLSSEGFNGTKHSWCKLSRLIASYTK